MNPHDRQADTRPRLQFAIDAPEHFGFLPRLARYFDIIEVGTPVLKRFGLSAITTACELAGGKPVMADTKTVDAGGLEAEMVFAAGAASMTALALAPTATRRAVLDVAARYGRIVIFDTILGAPSETDEFIVEMGGGEHWVGLHASSDARLAGDKTNRHINAVTRWQAKGARVLLAGGIGRANLQRSLEANADVIVIGSSVSAATDPEREAAWIRSHVDDSSHGS